MHYYAKVLITLLLVGVIICFAFSWDFIANKLNIKNPETNVGKSLVIFITILIQLISVITISMLYHFSFIDTLFVACFFILCITWLFSYFGNYNQNQYSVADKYQGASDFKVKVFNLKLNPVLIGIYSFSILGIVVSFLYYIPYFI